MTSSSKQSRIRRVVPTFYRAWPLWSGQSHTPEGDVDMSKKALHSARPLEAQGLSQGHT